MIICGKVAVEIVSLSNPAIAYKLSSGFDPILGKGDFTIVANLLMHNEALEVLKRIK